MTAGGMSQPVLAWIGPGITVTRMRRYLCLLALACSVSPVLAAEAPPRLAVVLIVDQMRSDYLVRFRPYFGEGGFKRMLEGGADYRNCHYRHAVTKTAAGHATILSGMHAEIHGIIGNEWADGATFEWYNAVEDRDAPLVGLPPRANRYANATFAAKAGRSPRNFLGTTVGDWLKDRYGAAAKTVGIAGKDRSAILPVGRHPDGAYWMSEGIFVTSSYYHAELPAWVQEFNAKYNASAYAGRTWDRLLDAEIYDRVQGPDDVEGENDSSGLPRTMPKTLGEPGGALNNAFTHTPWSNDHVALLAAQALESEGLGLDDVPDLLSIGFSQTDVAGHAYGPDSHEIMDSYLRLDRTLATLFAKLDAHVGAGRWVAVLTADHAVSPLPEVVIAKNGPGSAGRINGGALDRHVTAALDAAFGALESPLFWVMRDNSGYRVNRKALEAKNLTVDQVADEVAAALRTRPEVAAVYTRAQLTGPGPLDEWGVMTRRSYFPDRSADVLFIESRNFMFSSKGTNHGTAHEYDTHVPQLWYGAGVPAGERLERVGVDDIAPTLAGLLDVQPASEAKGRRLFP